MDMKSSSKSSQHHHVKYRMPYAWTAVHLADVICCSGGSDSLDRNSTGSGSNSLGKTSVDLLIQLKIN